MKSKAAIQVEPGGPLVVEEIDIPDPGPDQVTVRNFGRKLNGVYIRSPLAHRHSLEVPPGYRSPVRLRDDQAIPVRLWGQAAMWPSR
jgi:hypothetical protein